MFSAEQISRVAFRISSPLLDRTLKKVSSIQTIHRFLKSREDKRLDKIENLKKILVISGINIGDAVMAQSFLPPLKKHLPGIEISYLYQRKAYPLIKANPHIDRHFALIRNTGYPSKRDVESLKRVIKENDFDVIFNFCPYFSSRNFWSTRSPVIYPLRLIANVIKAYATNCQVAQIVFQMNQFTHRLIEKFSPDPKSQSGSWTNFSGNTIYFTQKQKREATALLEKLKVNPGTRKILFNPDTSCPYTVMPFEFQVELLKSILSQKDLTVLLSCGFNFPGIEQELLKAIPSSMTKNIVIVPKETPIDVYGGVIDNSHVFITGDTAPLHIAAAKRVIVDSKDQFRNRTAIVEIFGATSARIYGYDSFSDGYLLSAQQAPSKVFEAFPECKNLTCIDKIFKACPQVRCFEGLEIEPIIEYIRDYLSSSM